MISCLPDLYRARLAAGLWKADPDQARAMAVLDALRRAADRPWALRFFRRSGPCGAYLTGGVGRGKSAVMDLFFQSLRTTRKERVHFHAFMLQVHDFLHAHRINRAAAAVDDDLIACAAAIARRARVLCFDEFQVHDVADAMILARLFTALFDRGVTVVMTSNTAPDDLYAGGLQRELFLPFIALLKDRMDVVRFDGPVDYRREKILGVPRYFTPDDATASAAMEALFAALVGGGAPRALDIPLKGRVLHVPRAAAGVAFFSFATLCEEPKSALDYLELVRRFRVLFLSDIPKLDGKGRDVVLRFVALIDAAYDARVQLVVSAAAPPDGLHTGADAPPALARAISRLVEMQSPDYAAV